MSDVEESAQRSAVHRTGGRPRKRWLVGPPDQMRCRRAAAIALALVCSALARADTFRVLADDREAIQARIDLIQQAQQEIVVAHYALGKGRVPVSLLAVLQQAAQRGVRVRLMVDGLKSRFPEQLYRYLEAQGIEVRSYHPLRVAHPLWMNRRLHVKLLVVDGRQMVVGSRNLQDEHFGLNDRNFVDCDAYLCGSSAAHAHRYFDRLWQTEDVQPIRHFDSPTYGVLGLRPMGDDPWTTAWREARQPQDFQQLLMKSLAVLVQCHGIQLHTGYDWSADQPEDVPVAVLHDSDFSKHRHTVENSLLELIDRARHTVLIETGYPALTRATHQAILAARRRGVQVTLVTNSLNSIDNVAVYAAYQNLKRQLLNAEVRLWEYNGPETLHAKAMVIDGCTAMIGSYNFDPRSAYTNLELVVVARDRRAAADLRQVVLQHVAHARRITSRDASPLPHWFPSAADDAPPNVSAARWAKMQLHRLTMPTFRWLL